jgi:hypothetical protein
MVGGQPSWLIHRSARTGRHAGNGALLPRTSDPDGRCRDDRARIGFLKAARIIGRPSPYTGRFPGWSRPAEVFRVADPLDQTMQDRFRFARITDQSQNFAVVFHRNPCRFGSISSAPLCTPTGQRGRCSLPSSQPIPNATTAIV